MPNRPDGRHIDLQSRPTVGKQLTAKVDHLATPSDQLSFRLYRNYDEAETLPGKDNPLLLTRNSFTNTNATLNEVHTFGPNLLGEISAAYTRSKAPFELAPTGQSPKDLGAKYNQDGSVPLPPGANVIGRFAFSGGLWRFSPGDVIQTDGKLSWMTGKHSFKFGAQMIRTRYVDRRYQFSSGFFAFDGSFTENSMADFLIGRPVSLTQWSWFEEESLAGNYHFFVQDDFKLHPRLTLNLGLRSASLRTQYTLCTAIRSSGKHPARSSVGHGG